MKKKTFLMLLALVMVFAVITGGTLAYLTKQTGTVKNTFVSGKVDITLQEHKVKADGSLDSTTTTAGSDDFKDVYEYTILPGKTLNKDPFVTVKANSEKCYVYVLVANALTKNNTAVGVPAIDTANWTEVKTATESSVIYTLYKYKTAVEKTASDADLPNVFGTVTFNTDLSSDDVAALNNKTITVTAFAIQAENIASSDNVDDIAWTTLHQ